MLRIPGESHEYIVLSGNPPAWITSRPEISKNRLEFFHLDSQEVSEAAKVWSQSVIFPSTNIVDARFSPNGEFLAVAEPHRVRIYVRGSTQRFGKVFEFGRSNTSRFFIHRLKWSGDGTVIAIGERMKRDLAPRFHPTVWSSDSQLGIGTIVINSTTEPGYEPTLEPWTVQLPTAKLDF